MLNPDMTLMETLEQTRSRLMFERPFLGALCTRLELQITRRIPTAWTNGVVMRWNPDFCATKTFDEMFFIMAHEVYHCVLRHPFRFRHCGGGNPDATIFNMAADHAVNLQLASEGLPLPNDALCDQRFTGMAVEEIYAILAAEQQAKPKPEPQPQQKGEGKGKGEKGSKGAEGAEKAEEEEEDESSSPSAPQQPQQEDETGDGEETEDQGEEQPGASPDEEEDEETDPAEADAEDEAMKQTPGTQHGDVAPATQVNGEPLSESEESALEETWSASVASAATQAEVAGHLSAASLRAIRKSFREETSFEDYVRMFCSKLALSNLVWSRPNRRFVSGGLHLPSDRGEGIGVLVVAVDTSGSIGQQQLDRFQGTVQRIQQDMNPERVIVLYADAKLCSEESYERGEPAVFTKVEGGGGTDFAPVFSRVEELQQEGEQIVGVIYLTDLDGAFPDQHPEVPVLWAVIPIYGKRYISEEAPFGETVKLI